MNEIYEYIIEKLRNAERNSAIESTASTYICVLEDWELKLESLIKDTIEILQSGFRNDRKSEEMPHTKLASVMSIIGRGILVSIGIRKDVDLEDEVKIAEPFMEALFQLGYVHIERDASLGKDVDNRTQYAVIPTDKWLDLFGLDNVAEAAPLRGTQVTPYKPIRTLFRDNGRPLIKHQRYSDVNSFEATIRQEPLFVTAAERLESTKWRLNQGVYSAILSMGNSIFPVLPNKPNKVHYRQIEESENRVKTLEGEELALAMLDLEALKAERGKYQEFLSIQSKIADIKFILGKAKSVSELAAPYFHQQVELDYRGRCYYHESFLNYQGSDLVRALLEFGEGQLLTQEGVEWLMIHAACSYNKSYNIDEIPDWAETDYKAIMKDDGRDNISLDKMTLGDRVRWALNNEEFILDTADNNTLHKDAEKTFVFLAACKALADYAADPTGYVCHLPVPIDGTCNGYQHSAAIARDTKTGALVALKETLAPTDLYLQVARKMIELDPDMFNQWGLSLAQVRKGIAKRGTMTRAYSAGRAKIAENMFDDLYKEGYTKRYGITSEDCNKLAGLLIAAINEVCPGAQITMKFLQALVSHEIGEVGFFDDEGKEVKYEVVRDLRQELRAKPTEELKAQVKMYERNIRPTKGNGASEISWVSPSGFNVTYRKYRTTDRKIRVRIKGVNTEGRVKLAYRVKTDTPDLQGFTAGIAPNVIHSYDAAHMATVIANWDGPFGAVHDSFSSLPNQISDLADLTRGAFVFMYQDVNVLEDLKAMILSDDSKFKTKTPELGDLNLEEVYNSTYFFS